MTAHKYYKRGLVTAEQFDGSEDMAKKYGAELYSESGYGYDAVEGEPDGDGYVLVTLEGELLISSGMWIATGVNGEHWPIADGIFKKTYSLLPVIPQAVGEFIKYEHKNGTSLAAIYHDGAELSRNRNNGWKMWRYTDEMLWAFDHPDTFALAWLLGEWEVENG
ncbi:hypothetical protein [Lacticaseibacillus salsurivasis]|uniref:hypothetical protein n=1 Tax=Lacticaseibacillus salsurivasis TaxID=3081441 RepID=UPI0030C6AC85